MADTVANGAVSFVLLVSCFCNEVSPRVTKCHRRRRAGTAPIKKPKAPGQHAGCTGALRLEHSALRFDAGDNPIFQQARAPSRDELAGLLDKIIARLMKMLTHLGFPARVRGIFTTHHAKIGERSTLDMIKTYE